jgi:hypothetical protein
MKMFKNMLVALALVFTASSFAGEISFDIYNSKTTVLPHSEDLIMLDSITFERDSKMVLGDSALVKMNGRGSFQEDNLFPLNKVYQIRFIPDEASSDSLNIVIAEGAQKGKRTFALKDVKSIDFMRMDDSKDSDGDGVLDVVEFFVVGTDPNKPNNFNSTSLQGYLVYDLNGNKIGVCDMESNPPLTIFTSIPDTSVIVELVTDEPVSEMKVFVDNSPVKVTKARQNSYKFVMPMLSIVDSNKFTVEVTSLTKKTEVHNLNIDANFSFFPRISISLPEDRKSLLIYFAEDTVTTRESYAILRAVGSYTENNKALENFNVTKSDKPIEQLVPAGVSVIKVIDKDEIKKYHIDSVNVEGYLDQVGESSPFYTYRVVAFVKETVNGKDMYSYQLSEPETMGAGYIWVKYTLSEFGTEYYTYFACQADMRIKADFYSGNYGWGGYNYWFYIAGSGNHRETVIWETKADKNKDDNSVPIDNRPRYIYVGKDGFKINLYAGMDCGSHADDASHTLSWSYDDFVKALSGQKPKNTPFKGNKVITYGKDGISYDESCSNCGEEPHAGWKFNFDYGWVDDDFLYGP